jgi:hypothetical protein
MNLDGELRVWETPRIECVGRLDQVVQSNTSFGKTNIVCSDGGVVDKKPKGQIGNDGCA